MNPYGTSHAGEAHYRAGLTDALVRRLRREARTARPRSGWTTRWADRLDVTVPCIRRAVRGDTWRHLPGAVRRDLRYDEGRPRGRKRS
jgi:hypothetical protein